MNIFQGQKVLVVEDNLITFKLIEAHLEKRNLNLVHAMDGLEGVRLFKTHDDIELIIMDMQLPGMNGLEATKVIRKLNEHIPIIAATASAFEDDKEECLEAGCTRYITKPINFPLLMEYIEEHLA